MAEGFQILCSAILFIAGVCLLGVGAIIFAKAAQLMYQARYHGAQADQAQRELEVEPEVATPRSRRPFVAPTDEELRDAILAQRPRGVTYPEDDREYTTDANEGIEPEPPIMAGGIYAAREDMP